MAGRFSFCKLFRSPRLCRQLKPSFWASEQALIVLAGYLRFHILNSAEYASFLLSSSRPTINSFIASIVGSGVLVEPSSRIAAVSLCFTKGSFGKISVAVY